jgi:hypothetical protein
MQNAAKNQDYVVNSVFHLIHLLFIFFFSFLHFHLKSKHYEFGRMAINLIDKGSTENQIIS